MSSIIWKMLQEHNKTPFSLQWVFKKKTLVSKFWFCLHVFAFESAFYCRLWRLMHRSGHGSPGIIFRNIIDLTAFDTFLFPWDIRLALFKASGINVLKSPRMTKESRRSCSAPLGLLLSPGSGFFDFASDGGGTLLFLSFFFLPESTDWSALESEVLTETSWAAEGRARAQRGRMENKDKVDARRQDKRKPSGWHTAHQLWTWQEHSAQCRRGIFQITPGICSS